MAIVYTLNKIKDEQVLNVGQVSNFVLTYLSDNSNAKVEERELDINSTHTLAITKDGKYRLTLSAEGETDAIIEFHSIKNIQNSIITDARVLLCSDCDCDCTDLSAKCLSKAAKRCLKHKSVFVKLLSYQYLATPTYGASYLLTFTSFVQQAVATYNCKAQTAINNILLEECITGSVKDTEKLFTVYLALYWAGMYFIESALAFEDEDELDFIKTKYSYDQLIGCLCSTCIDMTKLKDIFDGNVDGGLLDIATIHSFQFEGIEFDITDAALVTDSFLTTNGALEDTNLLLAGKEINYTKLGRVGFRIKNTFPNKHNFLDVFNTNITAITFDRVYDEATLTETFVSKEYYTPSSVYYKLLKL